MPHDVAVLVFLEQEALSARLEAVRFPETVAAPNAQPAFGKSFAERQQDISALKSQLESMAKAEAQYDAKQAKTIVPSNAYLPVYEEPDKRLLSRQELQEHRQNYIEEVRECLQRQVRGEENAEEEAGPSMVAS